MIGLVLVSNRDPGSPASVASRRLAAAASDLGEFHFRHLLDRLPAGAYTCDADGLITYYNRHAVEIWGREPRLNDPVDRFCGSFKLFGSNGYPIPHDRCWMALAIKEEREYNGQEIVVQREDGRRHTVLAHATPVRDESGRMVGAVNVLVDITERKAVERALRESERSLRQLNHELESRVAERTRDLSRANDELQERNRDLEQFAYAASHDLQEPLRMVAANVQLLERRLDGRLDGEDRKYIGYAVEGARRMNRLIQDLLAFSRVGAPGRPFERVDTAKVVEAVIKDLGPSIEDTGAVVVPGRLPTIVGDLSQIGQLFQNLIANALKFRRPHLPPRVEVGADWCSDHGRPGWVFTVKDNGIGLDMQYAGRVFDVFQRLHSRDSYDGTGIGLAICKRIVERHGGRIWVDSSPGQGSLFHFTIP